METYSQLCRQAHEGKSPAVREPPAWPAAPRKEAAAAAMVAMQHEGLTAGCQLGPHPLRKGAPSARNEDPS